MHLGFTPVNGERLFVIARSTMDTVNAMKVHFGICFQIHFAQELRQPEYSLRNNKHQ